MATFDDVRGQNRSRTHVPPCGRMGFWWDRRYGHHASYGPDLVHALTGVEDSSMEISDIEWLFHATVFSVFDMLMVILLCFSLKVADVSLSESGHLVPWWLTSHRFSICYRL